MGCNKYKNATENQNHCDCFSPNGAGAVNSGGTMGSASFIGVTYSHATFPGIPGIAEIRAKRELPNIPEYERDFVMYPSSLCLATNTRFGGDTSCGRTIGTCGKIMVPAGTSLFGGTDYRIIDHYPGELSFEDGMSDEWFYYLYDTSNPVAGYPCYYIETITRTSSSTTTTTTPPTGEPGDPDYDPGGTSSSTSSSSTTDTECHPCTSFSCPAGATGISYSTGDGRLVDGRDPYPTLWTAHTTSKSIAFRYDDGVPTTAPIGAIDFSISGNGLAETDAWDQEQLYGNFLTVSDNPWADPDDIGFNSIIVVGDNGELNVGQNATGLRLKFRYEPSTTVTNNTETITGSLIRIDEVMSPGAGYSVNDTFNVSIPVNSGSIDFTLKVTAVGPVESSNPYNNYDLVNAGDTVNGHTVTSVKHMDLDFNYHVLELDGDGNDFTKDTSYTTNRGNNITVIAGHGIADRAFFGGMYEFRQKSFQYMTADLNRIPNSADNLKQPTAKYTAEVTYTSASDVVTLKNAADLAYMKVGYSVKSPSMPANTYITSISGNDITLSQSTTDLDNATLTYDGEMTVTNIEIVNGGIQSINVVNGGENWNLLNKAPKLELLSSTSVVTDAVIDYQFIGGVLQSVSITSRGSGYPQGMDLDIGISNVGKDVDDQAWPSSDRAFDRSNDIGDAVYSLPQFQNHPNESELIEIDTATQYGRQPRDYNYEGGVIDTFEKFQTILQRAAADRPKKQKAVKSEVVVKGTQVVQKDTGGEASIGLESLRFKTTLRASDLRSGMNKHQYEEIRFNNPINPINDVKRVKGVLRTERQERDLPDREDYEDLNWQTLDDRLPGAFKQRSGAQNFMQQLVDDDKVRKEDYINLNTEAPEVTASGKKLKTFDREEVITVRGTAFDLPCASKYTKYLLRQYKPDNRQTMDISVKLTWEPSVSGGCSDETGCAGAGYPFGGWGDAGSSTEGDTTTSVSYSSTLAGPYGEGCHDWEANGKIVIHNDLTNGAYVYKLAIDAYGNPFSFKCQ